MATTTYCDSFKAEAGQGGHCFNATMSGLAGAGVNGAFTITGLATTAGIAVGMAAAATGVAAGAVVASIDSATQVTLSKAHTGTVTSGTISFTGDIFKLALVKVSPTRTFDRTQTNIGTPGSGTPSATNLGTDEVAATGGYTSGGVILTNISWVVVAGVAVGTFANVSWPASTISATAAIIYNTSTRLGSGAAPLNGRTVCIIDFGGTQMTNGATFTLVMPTPDQNTGLLRFV